MPGIAAPGPIWPGQARTVTERRKRRTRTVRAGTNDDCAPKMRRSAGGRLGGLDWDGARPKLVWFQEVSPHRTLALPKPTWRYTKAPQRLGAHAEGISELCFTNGRLLEGAALSSPPLRATGRALRTSSEGKCCKVRIISTKKPPHASLVQETPEVGREPRTRTGGPSAAHQWPAGRAGR